MTVNKKLLQKQLSNLTIIAKLILGDSLMHRRSQETWSSEAFVLTTDTTVTISRTVKADSLAQAGLSTLYARSNQISKKNHSPQSLTDC